LAFTIAALGCAAAVSYQTLSLARAQRVNAVIASASVRSLDRSVPEAQFARAIALDQAGDY